MRNKRIHYFLIPILIVILAIYSYQRVNNNEEIEVKPTTEKLDLDTKNKETEAKPKVEMFDSDSPVQIGNCYSYEEDGNYYGVIIINYEDNELFTAGILYEVKKKELNNKDFEYGNLICVKSELIKGFPVLGLWTGSFPTEALKVFKDKFKYVGQINLAQSKIEINGGGGLIIRTGIKVKDLHDSELLKGMSRYKEPLAKYIEE